MEVGNKRVEAWNKHVSPESESIFSFNKKLIWDELLNNVSGSSHFFATHQASLVLSIQIVVFEVAKLGFFLAKDVFSNEVDVRFQQVSKAGVINQIEVWLTLFFDLVILGLPYSL